MGQKTNEVVCSNHTGLYHNVVRKGRGQKGQNRRKWDVVGKELSLENGGSRPNIAVRVPSLVEVTTTWCGAYAAPPFGLPRCPWQSQVLVGREVGGQEGGYICQRDIDTWG